MRQLGNGSEKRGSRQEMVVPIVSLLSRQAPTARHKPGQIPLNEAHPGTTSRYASGPPLFDYWGSQAISNPKTPGRYLGGQVRCLGLAI